MTLLAQTLINVLLLEAGGWGGGEGTCTSLQGAYGLVEFKAKELTCGSE